jgi:hypothetical protein
MIPESWLKERLQTTDVQDLYKRELIGSGLSDSDLRQLLSHGPSPQWVEKWRAFISQMIAGDELWFFESPPETWSSLSGRAGYALARAGHLVDSIVSRRS